MTTTTKHLVNSEYSDLGMPENKQIFLSNVGSEDIELFIGTSATVADSGAFIASKSNISIQLETGEAVFVRLFDNNGVGAIVSIVAQ